MKKRLLAMLLSVMLVIGMMPVSALAGDDEPAPGRELYVSADGVDAEGRGTTAEDPLKTLSKAVEYALDNDTIVLLTDITASSCARISDKHLTITSAPSATYTISRDTDFATIQDDARSTYNPAMIEVTTPGSKGASVTLKNIVLDDMGQHEGQYFLQAASDTTGSTGFSSQYNGSKEEYTASYQNTQIVQDAIVAAYGMGYGTAEITLGEGAVLKNYGGMSAVRVNGGATLTMESGSVIQDGSAKENWEPSAGYHTNSSNRKAKMDYGAAGAVWVQSTDATMNTGAEIKDVIGRAFYVDGGTVNINGNICRIAAHSDMTQGKGGTAIHVRGETANVTLKGQISEITGSGSSAVYVCAKGSFEMDKNAAICNCGTSVKGIQLYGVQGGTVKMNGEITGINTDNAININLEGKNIPTTGVLKCTIGPDAKIHDNIVSNGAIYMQTTGGTLDIYGKIYNNINPGGTAAGGLYMAHNHNTSTVTMHEGAEICNNYASKYSGVIVSMGTFIMEGGKISGNIANDEYSGVYVRNDGIFIMNGGEITNNYSASADGGLTFDSLEHGSPETHPYVQLNKGKIAGNVMNAIVDQSNHTATGGTSNDVTVAAASNSSTANITRYMTISDEMVIENEEIYVAKYGFSIENPANDVKFGNASAACEVAATTEYTNDGLTAVVGSLWYQTAGSNLPLTVYDLTTAANYQSGKELFAAVVETKVDGTPVNDANVQLFAVEPDEDGTCHLVLPGGNANGYAVVFLQEDQNNAQIVKVTPADITIYTGGTGYTGAVTGTAGTTASGMPEPGFFVTLPDSLDTALKKAVGHTGDGPLDLSNYLTFEAQTTGGESRSWSLQRYDANGVSTVTVGGKTMYVYRLVPASGQDPVRVQFTDPDSGSIVTNDRFKIDMDALYQKYDMSIYTNRVDTATIQAKVSDQVNVLRKEYMLATASGELTVRGVVDANTTEIKSETPTQADNVTAVAAEGTEYLINGSNIAVNDSKGVKLLVDDIVDEGKESLKEYLIEQDNNIDDQFNFDFKYLDLVDSDNGNVWIRPSKEMTIYWPYPEGTDSSDTFYVIHFESLDRDYDDLNTVLTEGIMQECEVQHVSGGITFEVDSFSPFALVWKENSSGGGGGGTTTTYTITASTGTGGTIDPSGKVSVTSGSDKKFTITPADGYVIADVLVDGKSVGAVSSYTFEKVKASHTISASFEKELVVVDPDETGVSAWLNTKDHKSYLDGYPDGTFKPGQNMTRAEAAQMFYNLLLDQDVAIIASFADVAADAWYTKAVNTLATIGMINGVSDDRYEPERSITRAEFTAIAMRFAKLPTGGKNIFSDVTESDWFYDVVVGSIQYGWINGYSDGTFRPNATITRAEVTAITNRMLGRSADTAYVDGHVDELRLFPDVEKGYWAYYPIVEATNAHDYQKNGMDEQWKGLL